MKLVWSRRAQARLRDITDYIAQHDPAAALKLIDTLVDSTEALLVEHPRAGRPGRVEGTREWVAHKRYIVVYRIDGDAVNVITVRHTSPRWPDRF